jgi:hypothetical protein
MALLRHQHINATATAATRPQRGVQPGACLIASRRPSKNIADIFAVDAISLMPDAFSHNS